MKLWGLKILCLLEPWLGIILKYPHLTGMPGPIWVTLTADYFTFSEDGACLSELDHLDWGF